MRKYLFRIENLLLLFPFLLFCFSEIFYGNTALDIHLHDTYFVISDAITFIPVFFVILILYFFHFVLRTTNRRSRGFCRFHVYVTICLCIVIAFLSYGMSYNGLAGAPRRYYDMSAWESFSYFSNVQMATAVFYIAFLLLQLVFFFYFLIKIIKKAK